MLHYNIQIRSTIRMDYAKSAISIIFTGTMRIVEYYVLINFEW